MANENPVGRISGANSRTRILVLRHGMVGGSLLILGPNLVWEVDGICHRSWWDGREHARVGSGGVGEPVRPSVLSLRRQDWRFSLGKASLLR